MTSICALLILAKKKSKKDNKYAFANTLTNCNTTMLSNITALGRPNRWKKEKRIRCDRERRRKRQMEPLTGLLNSLNASWINFYSDVVPARRSVKRGPVSVARYRAVLVTVRKLIDDIYDVNDVSDVVCVINMEHEYRRVAVVCSARWLTSRRSKLDFFVRTFHYCKIAYVTAEIFKTAK